MHLCLKENKNELKPLGSQNSRKLNKNRLERVADHEMSNETLELG